MIMGTERKSKLIVKEMLRCVIHKITLKRVMGQVKEEGRKLHFIVATLAGANKNKQ